MILIEKKGDERLRFKNSPWDWLYPSELLCRIGKKFAIVPKVINVHILAHGLVIFLLIIGMNKISI